MSGSQATRPVNGATIAEVLAQGIARRGCTHVFGLMGDGNMHLVVALEEAGVAVVETRHESAAVAMAEGSSWISGGIGFATVTHGPGLTHTATSLLVAARNRSSIVVLTAETPAGYEGAQTFDQRSFVSACEAVYRPLDADEDPADALDEVVEYARSARRPVVLAVPADLLTRTASPSAPHIPSLTAPAGPGAVEADAAARVVIDALEASARPLLLIGRGASAPDDADAVRILADRFGAALATTLRAKGLFDGHPGDLGVSGGLSSPASQHLLREADTVVAIGASLDRGTTQSMRLFSEARIVQVTLDPRPTPMPGVTPVRADAAMTLARSLRLSAGQSRDRWFGPVPNPAEGWAQDLVEYAPALDPDTLDPRRALALLDGAIPEDAYVVLSNGHCSGFAAAFIRNPAQGRTFTAQGFGSIGQALTSGIGVAVGSGNRKVVVFEGDSAFMMHAQELETAARAGVDLTLVVLNDQALGTEYQRLDADGSHGALALVPTPDLASLARALGARAESVTSSESIPEAAARALAPGLAVLELRTSRTVISRHMRGHLHRA